jgi:hypothetical protein
VSGLLLNAFRAIGAHDPSESRRDRHGGHRTARQRGRGGPCPLEKRENWDRCCDIALEAGVSHVTALDLVMAFTNPVGFAKLIPPEARLGRKNGA